MAVGAHIGTVALAVAKHFERVILVEANPKTARLLERNILLQQHKNVRLIQAAVSDAPGELEFVLNRVNSGGSKRLAAYSIMNSYVFDAERQNIRAVRLDDVVDQSVVVILMDIEGGEFCALRGMRRIPSGFAYLLVESLLHLIRNAVSVGIDEWLQCVPLEFDRAYWPDQGVTVSGRGQILEFLRDKFEFSSNIDQLVFFCADRNPVGLG